MRHKGRTIAIIAGLSALWAVSAHATTYYGVEAFQGNTLDLSITTDDATGILAQTDVTSYDVKVYGPNGFFDLTSSSPSDAYQVQGPNLVATPTALTFNFDESNEATNNDLIFIDNSTTATTIVEFCGPGSCPGENYYTLGPAGMVVAYEPYSGVGYHQYFMPTSGIETIATVSAAPEPSTWMFMIAGIGMIGTMLRTHRRESWAVAA